MRISDLVPWRSEQRNLPARREDNLFRQEVNRLFEELFQGFDMMPWGEGSQRGFTPRVDVSETDEAITVAAELPGMDQENIDISITGDVLTIQGEKKAETEQKEQNYYRVERSYGSFRRDIPLPQGVVNRDSCEATFKNGVLHITLPKRPEAQQLTRKIDVRGE
jgi:HSP20 family protein